MSNYTPDAAYSVYRNSGAFYRALISRPTEKIKRYTIAATTTQQVAVKGNRHTLTVINRGSVDVRLGETAAEAESTDGFLDLLVGESKYFEYHISGYELATVGRIQVLKAIFHCEWSEGMFIRNPGAASATVEVHEVG